MTINYNIVTQTTYSAATVADLYTNSSSSDAALISLQVTGLYAAGCTIEVQLTDGSNNIIGYLIPPATPLSQNNGYTVSDKVIIPNGYKLRFICSVVSTSTPMKIMASIVEGMS